MKSLSPTRLFVFCFGLCLLALLPSGASAQTDEIDRLRADRDALRAEVTRAAADLDPLLTANDELEEGIQLLNEDLAARRAELAATEAQLQQARIEIELAQQEVTVQQAIGDDLRVQLQRQAITAYVLPGNDQAEDVLRSSDLSEGERRRALFAAVQTSQADILDALRIAEADRELAVARAENAQRQIAVRQQLAQEQLAEVNAALLKQQELQAVLDDRIAEFRAEVDLLAGNEASVQAEIAGLIIAEENRVAAIREAARIQAERERVAQEQERLRLAQLEALARGEVVAERAAVSQASAQLVSAPPGASLIWPVGGPVTSGFGPRWGRQHNGIDIAANSGTTVAAGGAGTVIAAGNSGAFGNRVMIDHGGGLVTLYAHLSSINVSNGQSVNAGTAIGAIGCTGSCTGPHLHLETRINGVAYNPLNYLS